MARMIPAFTQFFDDNGDPLISGFLQFYQSGTTTDKDTFSDINETIPNANPVPLDGAGRCPNVFGSGAYKIISYDASMVQYQSFDPVISDSVGGAFASWDAVTIYSEGKLVTGSDLKRYSSIFSSNQGSDPVTSPAEWKPITFISTGIVDNSVAAAITIDANSNIHFASTLTITALKAMTAPLYDNVNIHVFGYSAEGDGGNGIFKWDASNLSTEVTSDTLNGIYVPPNADNTGASGAWVREHSSIINVRWFGATGDGATDDSAAITAANTYAAALTNGGEVLFPSGVYKVSVNTSISSNVAASFSQGAKLSVDIAKTFTINGPIISPLQQIFSGVGSISVGTQNEYIPEYHVSWFGLSPSNSDAVNDAALATLIACIPSGNTIQWGSGVYQISTHAWPYNKVLTWRGVSPMDTDTTPGTEISGSGADVISNIEVTTRYSVIENIKIKAAAGNTALNLQNLGTILSNVLAYGGAYGIKAPNSVGVEWHNVTAYGTTAGLYIVTSGSNVFNLNTLINVATSSRNATGTATVLGGAVAGSIVGNNFIGLDVETSNVGLNMNANAPEFNTFHNLWGENMTGGSEVLLNDSNTSNSIFINPHFTGAGSITYGNTSSKLAGGDIQVGSRLFLPPVTVATLPAAVDNEGSVVYVSDEAGGSTLALSNGTDWRRVQDRVIVT